MIWGGNFFFAALFLPQTRVSCCRDSVDPICCQGAAFVSELCHLNHDSYRFPSFFSCEALCSHGKNPWYQHDTQHWHVVCFIPALTSYIFPGEGKQEANILRLEWGCHSGNLRSLAMLRKTCMNLVNSMSKKWLCSWGTPGEHKSSAGWVA